LFSKVGVVLSYRQWFCSIKGGFVLKVGLFCERGRQEVNAMEKMQRREREEVKESCLL